MVHRLMRILYRAVSICLLIHTLLNTGYHASLIASPATLNLFVLPTGSDFIHLARRGGTPLALTVAFLVSGIALFCIMLINPVLYTSVWSDVSSAGHRCFE